VRSVLPVPHTSAFNIADQATHDDTNGTTECGTVYGANGDAEWSTYCSPDCIAIQNRDANHVYHTTVN
jgi:hypothetical protein